MPGCAGEVPIHAGQSADRRGAAFGQAIELRADQTAAAVPQLIAADFAQGLRDATARGFRQRFEVIL